MHVECLVADSYSIRIVGNHLARHRRPGFYQPFLQQRRFQSLFPEILQNQFLDTLNVSLEHGLPLHRIFYSRAMRLRESGPDGLGWCR